MKLEKLSQSSPTAIVTLGSSSPLDSLPSSPLPPPICDVKAEKENASPGDETDHYESGFEFEESNLRPENDPRCHTMAFIANQ